MFGYCAWRCCVCLCVLCCWRAFARALHSTWICVFNRKGNKCLYTYADKISPCTKTSAAYTEIDSSLDTFSASCASSRWHHEFDQDENGIIKRALVLLPNAPETTTTINSYANNKDETNRSKTYHKAEEWKKRREREREEKNVKWNTRSRALWGASVNKSVIRSTRGKWKKAVEWKGSGKKKKKKKTSKDAG